MSAIPPIVQVDTRAFHLLQTRSGKYPRESASVRRCEMFFERDLALHGLSPAAAGLAPAPLS